MDKKIHAVKIQGRFVGENHPCFIIAEAGVNHNGDPGLAHQLIDVASEAGADAIKFQRSKQKTLSLLMPKRRNIKKKMTPPQVPSTRC